jgi:hypothetical protein
MVFLPKVVAARRWTARFKHSLSPSKRRRRPIESAATELICLSRARRSEESLPSCWSRARSRPRRSRNGIAQREALNCPSGSTPRRPRNRSAERRPGAPTSPRLADQRRSNRRGPMCRSVVALQCGGHGPPPSRGRLTTSSGWQPWHVQIAQQQSASSEGASARDCRRSGRLAYAQRGPDSEVQRGGGP